MRKQAKQLMIACMFPLLILLGLCFLPLYTLLSGDDIILKTRPIDPSDVFRGDFVALNYEIEEIPVNLVEKAIIKKSGINVYVQLREKDGIYTPINVTAKKPSSGIYLKGTLDYVGEDIGGRKAAFIHYSLDKYYVEDNTGTEWEKASEKGEILAQVKVKNGYGILTGIKKQAAN